MAEAVYALCTMTSVVCAILLFRGYRQSRMRLLLWSGLCFVGHAINNAFVFVDLVILPDIDLSVWRGAVGLVAIAILVFGLVWETE